MDFIKHHQQVIDIVGAGVLLLEQILPHLPIKADSTVQLIINIGKWVVSLGNKKE